MKRFVCLILSVLLILSMTACAQQEESAVVTSKESTEEESSSVITEESLNIPETAEETIVEESEDTFTGPYDAQEIYQLYENSIVKIDTGNGGGSGFYIEEDVICTNFHVIKDALSLDIYTPNRMYGEPIHVVEVLGWLEANDVALLRVDTPCERPIPIRSTNPYYGEPIYSIGNPAGIFPYLSEGIVTKAEHFGDHGTTQILTNMDVFGGMSGSAAIDQNGEVIGIVSGGIDVGANNDMTVIVKAFYIKQVDRSESWTWEDFTNRNEIAMARVAFEDAEIGNIVGFGHYEQDNVFDGEEEEIEWIVLDKRDDGALMLMSLLCLDGGRYSFSEGEVTWETSYARSFLNGDFLNTAFNAQEQARILTTRVHTEDNEEFGTSGGNDTDDQVYILSLEEVRRFYGIEERIETFFDNLYAEASEYTKTKDVWLEVEGSNRCWWWLRSSGGDLTRAAEVGSLGYLSYNGTNAYSPELGGMRAYRPVIWVLPE